MRTKKSSEGESVRQESSESSIASTFKQDMNMIKSNSKKIITVIVGAIILAALGYAFFTKTSYGKTLRIAWQLQKEQQAVLDDKKVLAQLGRIMVLPEGVDPTMALVTDIDALKKEQPEFFANAKNGDRVVIYPDLVIVFDPEANKIMKIGPVRATVPPTQPTQSRTK